MIEVAKMTKIAEKMHGRSVFSFESDSRIEIISSCAIWIIGHVDYENELIYVEMRSIPFHTIALKTSRFKQFLVSLETSFQLSRYLVH